MRGQRARRSLLASLGLAIALVVVGAPGPLLAQVSTTTTPPAAVEPPAAPQVPANGVTFEPWSYPVNTYIVVGGTPGPLRQRVILPAADDATPATAAQGTTTTTTVAVPSAQAVAVPSAQAAAPHAETPPVAAAPAATGASGPLASTGVDAGRALFFALIALDIGVVFIAASRTRRVSLCN